jgi:hypothetical protein
MRLCRSAREAADLDIHVGHCVTTYTPMVPERPAARIVMVVAPRERAWVMAARGWTTRLLARVESATILPGACPDRARAITYSQGQAFAAMDARTCSVRRLSTKRMKVAGQASIGGVGLVCFWPLWSP